jgi:hypothetical protein
MHQKSLTLVKFKSSDECFRRGQYNQEMVLVDFATFVMKSSPAQLPAPILLLISLLYTPQLDAYRPKLISMPLISL